MTLYTCMQGRRFLSGLLAVAAAAAPASAVVRFRGCGGVCGCHRTSTSSNGLAGVDDRIFFKNKLRAGCYEHLDDHLVLANQASLAIEPGSGLATYPDTQSRGNAVGVVVVDVPGRAVGGLLDLLDTDQVTWYQIIHESDAQAFRLLTSIIVLQ